MNARIDSYLQMPFREFVDMFPEVAADLRENLPIFDIFLADPHYIVRVKQGKIEIGYTEDAWTIS